jgi:thiamine-monophosphate kinase
VSSVDPDLQPRRIRALAESIERAGLPHLETNIDDDDCAVFRVDAGAVVATTDFINSQPISQSFGIGDKTDLGWLSVANNVSDLVGSGATPIAFLSALVLEHGTSEPEFDQIMRGILEACNEFGIRLAAGDTKLGRALAIGGTALGYVSDPNRALRRDRASAGQDVWLTGPIGGVASALVLLNSPTPLGKDVVGAIRKAILRPTLPLALVSRMTSQALCSAGTDVSDGLVADIHTLCRSSKCGVNIETDMVPLSPLASKAAHEHGLSDFALAASIGGDLQSVFTADISQSRILRRVGLTRIGRVIEGDGVRLVNSYGAVRNVGFTGHRDARRMSFFQEVLQIARELDA